MITASQQAALSRPFPPDEIEWRVAQTWIRDDQIGGRCFAYVTAREVMSRFDLVFGPSGWSSFIEPFTAGRESGFKCRIEAGGVSHEDVSDMTDVESVKGGASGALKRAAIHFGVGRYLYDLPSGFFTESPNGQFHAEFQAPGTSGQKKRFRWDPPSLPGWAIPDVVDVRVGDDNFVPVPLAFVRSASKLTLPATEAQYAKVLSALPDDLKSRIASWSRRWDLETAIRRLIEIRARIVEWEDETGGTVTL